MRLFDEDSATSGAGAGGIFTRVDGGSDKPARESNERITCVLFGLGSRLIARDFESSRSFFVI